MLTLRIQNMVSIHTRHHWRVKPVGAVRGARGDCVSIHTRHHWRVKPRDELELLWRNLFQSTPAITGG